MSAMALFLKPFFNDLEDKLLMKNIGAISSKFFETVGWRSLGYEKIVEAKIDSMVFDIDQVVLEIDDLNINSTLNENDLLDQMYNNLSKIVFCHKLDTSRVKLNITEFQRNAKLKSGHTYMDKNTREKYFNIVSGNYVANPFKLSVKFSTNYSKGSSYIPDCKIFLWDKIVKVAVWLLINKSNQPYLETELTRSLNDPEIHTDIYYGAPFFSLLVYLYLIHSCKVSAAIETYGLKDYRSFKVSENVSYYDECIGKKCKKYIDDQTFNNFTVIKNFVYCLKTILKQTTYHNELHQIIHLKVGCGATVTTKHSNSFGYTVINPIVTQTSFDDSIKLNRNIYARHEALKEKGRKQNINDHKIDTYPIFGSMIPVYMQPTTVSTSTKLSNIVVPGIKNDSVTRIQCYSKTVQHVHGEYKTIDGVRKTAKIANFNRLGVYCIL
jgi:hypothetical protein